MNNSMSVYSRFSPHIREYIYRKKWKMLHTFQEEAAKEIFDNGNHLLIAAGTASGKTEAVFFPLLSILETLLRAGEKALVLYISPLKALINDQAQRLENLLLSGSDSKESSITTVWRWHGDIDSSSKKRFLENPGGVLLITPESLEALLLRQSGELGRIFNALLFVVIDEVHVFMGTDRGSQLMCQLARIQMAQANDNKRYEFRRIGLSATLGDYKGGQRWLSQGSSLDTALVEDIDKPSDRTKGKQLSLALDYHAIHSESGKDQSLYRSLYNQCRNKRTIIFTNSRLEAEECAASLGALALSLGEANIFQIHHGSVSALLRDEAEERLKTGEGPKAVCATATLELGIDIGDLDRIIQIGPPWSVSAFVQRLGRSGRRSGRAEMYFCIIGSISTAQQSCATHQVPWELLKTMAVIQLYLEEKWIEPPMEKVLPFSLLVHQTLAILASLGEHSPQALSGRLLSFPPFEHISTEDFNTLLIWLEQNGCIAATEEGTLILGLEGENIVNHYSFYPVFPGELSFRVIQEGREIATVNFVPDPQSVLAAGGRRWVVKSIDPVRREIWVSETEDRGNERLWRGRGSGIHKRINQTIQRILTEDKNGNSIKAAYPYLSEAACKALEAGLNCACMLGIGDQVLIANQKEEKNTLYLFPWTGNRGMRTISTILGNEKNKKKLGLLYFEEMEDLFFLIESKLGTDEFRSALAEICKAAAVQELLQQNQIHYTDKYDYLLPPQLLAKQYAANMLDYSVLEELHYKLVTV